VENEGRPRQNLSVGGKPGRGKEGGEKNAPNLGVEEHGSPLSCLLNNTYVDGEEDWQSDGSGHISARTETAGCKREQPKRTDEEGGK